MPLETNFFSTKISWNGIKMGHLCVMITDQERQMIGLPKYQSHGVRKTFCMATRLFYKTVPKMYQLWSLLQKLRIPTVRSTQIIKGCVIGVLVIKTSVLGLEDLVVNQFQSTSLATGSVWMNISQSYWWKCTFLILKEVWARQKLSTCYTKAERPISFL